MRGFFKQFPTSRGHSFVIKRADFPPPLHFLRHLHTISKLEEHGKSVLILGIALALYKRQDVTQALVGDVVATIVDVVLGHVFCLVRNKVDIHMTDHR